MKHLRCSLGLAKPPIGRRPSNGDTAIEPLPFRALQGARPRNTRIPGETTIEDREIVIGRRPPAVRAGERVK